jgi:hypothetical protein
MVMRIDLVQSVGKHPYRLIAVLQSLPVHMDIHAIGKTADNEHVRAQLSQDTDEAAYQLLTVRRALSRP